MMASRARHSRRRFLHGAGGIVLGLPLLDADGNAHAEGAHRPFFIAVVGANGVVQQGVDLGGQPEPERFWLPSESRLADDELGAAQDRATSELSGLSEQLVFVKGIAHDYPATGCGHASGDAQVLTGAPVVGSNQRALADGVSLDTLWTQHLGVAQEPSLVLHAGKYTPGDIGFDTPGYVSYGAPQQPRIPFDSPLKAYSSMVGLPETQELLRGQHSINDLLTEQLSELARHPRLSGQDHSRLEQHLEAVRNVELRSIQAGLSQATHQRMTELDRDPHAEADHEELIRLHMDLAALALSSGFCRAVTLKVGDRQDDHSYQFGGQRARFHDASHLLAGDASQELHHAVDRLQMRRYRYLVERLRAVNSPTGPLLDSGVCAWTNQIANGAHAFSGIPWILAGGMGGELVQGQVVQGEAGTASLLKTLLVAGARCGGASIPDPRQWDGVPLLTGLLTR